MKKLFSLREEYRKGELREAEMLTNPLEQFGLWLQAAIDSEIPEPNAMTLATSSPSGIPSARVVLLKEIAHDGFVFFTNYTSRKGRELLENPFAALVFDWHEMERQVRVEGRVQQVSHEESDIYFHSRPETGKLGAWVSPQSKLLKNRRELDDLQLFYEDKFKNTEIPRPPHWGGFIVLPTVVEFWQGRPNRLHDRIVYQKTDKGWEMNRLAP